MNSKYHKHFNRKRLYTTIAIIIITFLLLSFIFFNRQNGNVKFSINISETDIYPGNKIENDIDENIDVLSQTPNTIKSTDNNFETLQEDDIIRETQRFEAMERVPVDPARNDFITNMRNESIKETILNLANFDDDMLASFTINVVESAVRNALLVTRLMRVRKLYSIGLQNPDHIIPDLQKLQRDSLKKWPEAHDELIDDYENHIGRSEPASYDRIQHYNLAATYLLAEFGDFDSLPFLSYQYKMHHILEPGYSKPFVSPVEPCISFYAMHRLAISYPRNSLSREASQALDEYLDAADNLVPEPEQIQVTVWDASYIESDPRLLILNIKNEALEGQESMTMPLYPTKYLDGTRIQGPNGSKLQKTNELFEKLDAFVQIVYPPEENQVP